MFPSVKAAIGWYAAFRQGPELKKQNLGPRVQEGRIDPGAQWVEMAQLIARVRHEQKVELDDLLRWASTSDGDAPGPGQKAMKALRVALESANMLDPPVKRVECEPHTFVDLNTGETITTKRAK